MDDKIKVKDLATELGVSPRDLTRVLRELDVEVKSPLSNVSADEAAKAKARLQPESHDRDEVMRKEIQPGLIVRRRRVRESEEEAPAPHEAAVAAPAPEAVEQESAKPEAAPRASAAHAVKTPEVAVAAAPAAPAAPVATIVSTPAPAAKVKESPAPAETPVAAPAPAPQPVEAAPVVEAAAQEAQPEAPVAETPVAEAPEAVESAEEVKEVQPQRRKGRTKVETPMARIVRPAEAPKPAEPEPAPVVQTVEAAPVAAEARPVEAEKTESAEARAERRRGQQPAASASPEGSSKPSLLPPVNEARRQSQPGAEGEDRPRRRPQEAPAPQVRVISRPEAGRPEPRDARPAPRDGQDQRPRTPRPFTPRPGGAPGGAPGGGQAPGSFPFQPPVEGADQSRKKRNKGRRTVDFPQTGNFGRHGDDDDAQVRSRGRGRKPRKQQVMPQATQPMKAAKRKIRVDEAIRVTDLAHQMGLKSGEIIKVLFGLGIMATINNALDIETAGVVAAEFGYEVEKTGFSEETYLTPEEVDSPEQLKPRPPVVTIMGHVDHGKTSLLDAIRKTNVIGGEAGGITQHIGAYHVKTKRGEIVFLDTPGHEAFTAMRARGAQVTDLVVLVVAADDGVMEQTREAINHAKAANVPIMVAVNKMDKEAANPDRVLRELAELGLQAEEWGGDVVVSKVSAKTRMGLDDLLELIALQAEVLELKANPDKLARGHIVEARLDKGRGPVATVLIQEGTLHQGDAFVCGVFAGRVRAMFNDQGRKVKEAGPAIPVEVQGFEGVPEAGEDFISLTDEKAARRIAESRAVKLREKELAKESRVTLETFLSRRADSAEAQVLNLVLKADVQGSLEAISEALRKLSTDKVRIEIIHGGAGAISETDIMLAAASEAIIIGFNVRPTAKVKDVAEQEQVDIRFYDIIYKLVDEIKSAMAGMLAPVKREVYLGQAEVRDTFALTKSSMIAGCHISDGKLTRNAGVRLLRDGVVTYTGKISSLRRFKDDVKEVLKGYECGVGLENFNDIKPGDVLEAFETVEEAATL